MRPNWQSYWDYMLTPKLADLIDFRSYQTMAGPDWPSYEQLISGKPAGSAAIQLEIDNFVAMMRETYEQTVIPPEPIDLNNQLRQQQIFYDKKYNGPHCKRPWDTLGINSRGDAFICPSPSWLPKFVGNILKVDSIFDVLNSSTAQQIRQEILAGRYYYCNNRICGFFGKIDHSQYQFESVDNQLPLDNNFSEDTIINEIPTNLIFDFDYTCNFQCPSCRTQVINWNKDKIWAPINQQIVEKIKTQIIDKISKPTSIRWAGGEPFISNSYLQLLEYTVLIRNKNISHIIQTNGSYLKSKQSLVIDLLPYIKELRISFDAATAETYKKIRVNGVWENLIENVQLVKSLIDELNVDTQVIADYVVQLDNYKEIPTFVALCQQLGIKQINFQKMWNWDTWSQSEFKNKNIYDPSHPNYQELSDIFTSLNIKMSY